MPPVASPLITYGIAVLALAVAALMILGARSKTVILGVAAIMAAQIWLASSGILHQWDRRPPPFIPMMLACFVIIAFLAFSPIGTRMASTFSYAVIIGTQAFRFPLELVMHRAASEGVMPPQMTYSGSNFDIVSGVTAILVALLAAKGSAPRWLLIGWNTLGSILLLNIVVVAVISTPMFAAYGNDRLNTWVAYPPFVWLPGVLVPAALLGHLLLWRKLFARPGSVRKELR